jgi:hypothetical protein
LKIDISLLIPYADELTMLIALFYLICILCIGTLAFNGRHMIRTSSQLPNSRSLSISDTKQDTGNDVGLVTSLAKDLEPYFQLRQTSGETISMESLEEELQRRKLQKKETPFFAMVSPSGWYKDKDAIDLKARSDSRIPLVSHPLSLLELEKYGYERFYDQIMQLGGPYAAATAIGYEWTPPPVPSEWTEDMRPVTNESYALSVQGELSLGGSLEEKLQAAERIDVEAIKATIARLENSSSIYGSMTVGSGDAFDTVDYPSLKGKKSKWLRAPTPIEEEPLDRFSLYTSERVYSVFTCAALAVGYGRATSDLPIDIREIAQYVSLGAIGVAVSSAGMSVKKALEAKRDAWLWGIMALLGGPFAFRRLSSEIEPSSQS